MTSAIKPHSFQSVASLPTSDGTTGAPVVGEASGAPAPILGRRRPAVYGYDSMDIEMALRGIECALPFALAAFKCHIENNEHVESFVDWQGFADRLTDMVADELRGPLMKRMEEMRGER